MTNISLICKNNNSAKTNYWHFVCMNFNAQMAVARLSDVTECKYLQIIGVSIPRTRPDFPYACEYPFFISYTNSTLIIN